MSDAAYHAAYYAANRDKILARARKRKRAKHDEVLAKDREYRAKNREQLNEKRNAWRARNAERIRMQGREANKRLRARNPTYFRDWSRNKKIALAGRPPGPCDACGRKLLMGRNCHWDHDHATGKFRGWLCDRCNTVLGRVNDDPALLRSLACYLEGGIENAV